MALRAFWCGEIPQILSSPHLLNMKKSTTIVYRMAQYLLIRAFVLGVLFLKSLCDDDAVQEFLNECFFLL